MTIERAREVATNAAIKWNKAFVVWRMPAWRVGVYGVIEQERGLPPLAMIEHTAQPPKTGLLF